jgi:hypothetical protein
VELTTKQATEFKCLECSEKMEPHEVRAFLDRPLHDMLEKAQLNKCLQGMPDFRWCAKPGCGYGGLASAEDSFYTCDKCRGRTCYRHRVPWHTGVSCDDYDATARASEENATSSFLKSETKACPRCSAPSTKKKSGCDHVTCLCGYEYCWRCLADFRPIRREGNHRHNSTCTHYFPWDGQEE